MVHTGNGNLGEEVQIQEIFKIEPWLATMVNQSDHDFDNRIQFSDNSQVQNQVPVSVFKNGEKIFIIQGTPSQIGTPPQGGGSDGGMPLSPENISTNQNQPPKKKKVER